VICKEKGLQDLPSEQELLDEQLAQEDMPTEEDEDDAEPEVGAKRRRVYGGKTKRKTHNKRKTVKHKATKRKTHNKRKTAKLAKRGKK
jgi:hypothetical protein